MKTLLEIDERKRTPLCRRWLYAWQSRNLGMLHKAEFHDSPWLGQVTLLMHSFQPNENAFNEFPILHTWRMIGKLPTVIITDHETTPMLRFRECHTDLVSIAISPFLKRGDIDSLSLDCLNNLGHYFDTPYCLIIQDDGFPLRDNLGDFLGKWDYIGAPCVKDLPRQYVADVLLLDCLNGGFCLRSHRLCAATAREWRAWGWKVSKRLGWTFSEDWFYSVYSRYNPIHRLRFRFPWASQARRFSAMDLAGGIDLRKFSFIPFGAHSPTTFFLYRDVLASLGYEPVSLEETLTTAGEL